MAVIRGYEGCSVQSFALVHSMLQGGYGREGAVAASNERGSSWFQGLLVELFTMVRAGWYHKVEYLPAQQIWAGSCCNGRCHCSGWYWTSGNSFAKFPWAADCLPARICHPMTLHVGTWKSTLLVLATAGALVTGLWSRLSRKARSLPQDPMGIAVASQSSNQYKRSGVAMATLMSQKVAAVGRPAPDFKMVVGHGAPHSLLDYRGEYVVILFYPAGQATPFHSFSARSFPHQALYLALICAHSELNADHGQGRGNVPRERGGGMPRDELTLNVFRFDVQSQVQASQGPSWHHGVIVVNTPA